MVEQAFEPHQTSQGVCREAGKGVYGRMQYV